MPVSRYEEFIEPVLRYLHARADGSTTQEAYAKVADAVGLTTADRAELLPSGKQALYQNRIGWAFDRLKRAGLARGPERGVWALTAKGDEYAVAHPDALSPDELKRLASVGGDDVPVDDGDAPTRIRRKLERAIPEEALRRSAMELLAYAIENADDERSDAWYLKETARGLALYAGRLIVCKVTRRIQISVMGPLPDEIRAALAVGEEDSEAWKFIPGGLLLTVPHERASAALEHLRDGLDRFVDAAMARVRSRVSLEDHMSEGVLYVSSVVGRDLPQPTASTELGGEDESEADEPASRDPVVRGRSPIFEHAQRSIASLVDDIGRRTLALPDLQRPFVWEDARVRDLLDSLFVGYPVGTLVLWHTSAGKDARALGGTAEGLEATCLVIDGQQRLTALYAVMRGEKIVDRDGSTRRITIAFRPRDGRFEVADAAIRNDPEYLPDVSVLWGREAPSNIRIWRELSGSLERKGRVVDRSYEEAVLENLDRAKAIQHYSFPVIDIRRTATAREASEEDVAEIFVRLNNQGRRLGQIDFVMTLLSVFHGELRDRIEVRAASMPADAVVQVDAQQLLRASCAIGFSRAKMSAVYRYLHGVDPDTGDTDQSARQERLRRLDDAAGECLDETTWSDFVVRVVHAGFANHALVASNNAVVNAYAFYVLGRRCQVPRTRLDEVVSRWVFGTLLSARYSGSSESQFEQDLARVRDIVERADREAFVTALDGALDDTLTGEYWTRTLVSALETQKARASAALAFRAAQVILGARGLFSDVHLRVLLAPPARGKRAASEVHHLFPQAWLVARGITERRRVNQVANLADVGWFENSVIGARGPADYVPRVRDQLRLGDDAWGRMCAEHALPPGWESMEYDTFLRERRLRMADLVRVAYRKLGGEAEAVAVEPPWFLAGAEGVWRRIVDGERALRAVVREVYGRKFGDGAATRIEDNLAEKERETLLRALRARPASADPLSVVDYLYLGQLPKLLFAGDVWPDARQRFGGTPDAKQRLQSAVDAITPIRNEIAHVREVSQERLLKATVACNDLLAMIGS